MSEEAETPEEVRAKLLSDPDLILQDHDLMQALVTATEKTLGGNVVDIRGIAMQRLEARLGRLEDTHKSVIAAAYENLAGTTLIHRAVLRLLEPTEFEDFLKALEFDVRDLLRVSKIKLVLESHRDGESSVLHRLGGVVSIAEPGFVDDYITHGRDIAIRPVTLRTIADGEAGLYGRDADRIYSEACIKLDMGEGCLPALLALGVDDDAHFAPNQGTDLLQFFGSAFERLLRRWLS
jgi:uncharacterized protein YigA (DUF484 family)